MKLTILIFFFIGSQLFSQAIKNKMNLVETEYEFAAVALEKGTRDAFLEFIDEEGILFRPHPVNGKEFLSNSEKRPGLLIWYPSFSRISASGELGVNTGPWEFKRNADEEPVAFGNFVTIWKKQSDGSWKFLIDLGNNNQKPAMEIPGLGNNDITLVSNNSGNSNVVVLREELIELEKNFSLQSTNEGLCNSYLQFVNHESRYIRNNMYPVIGSSIIELLKEDNRIYKWEPYNGRVSSTNDLGYTYGKINVYKDAELKQKDYALYYLRVWQNKGGGWKILIDVAVEIPGENESD